MTGDGAVKRVGVRLCSPKLQGALLPGLDGGVHTGLHSSHVMRGPMFFHDFDQRVGADKVVQHYAIIL